MVPSVRRIVRQRGTLAAIAVVGCGLLIGVAGSATAAPAPTLSQAQAKLSSLQGQLDKLSQRYDSVLQQLSVTNQRLKVLDSESARYSVGFLALRKEVGQIAITAYEDGNFNSSLALLASGNPQQILNRSSLLQQLSTANNAKIGELLASAKQLTTTQAMVQRTKAGIVHLGNSLRAQTTAMNKLVSQQKVLVSQLTPVQAAAAAPSTSGSTSAVFTGNTSTQGGKAVAFAYAKLGCPYLFGGTSCSPGFDCSGLTQAAWAAAGVSIERTSEDQWASLPHVSTLQPGDIMVFSGAGHVGIYVGLVKGVPSLIDAPVPGAFVELVSWTGWYKTNYDGAVRP
jgi:cell wall-associated NlpC family hydrolase